MLERVRITVTSGRVHVTGEERDGFEADGVTVSGAEPELELKGGSERATVRIPTTTDVVLGTSSGTVRIDGRVAGVSVTTSSADIKVDEVGSIDARSTSGKLRVGTCHGGLRLGTKSSTVHVGRVDGDVNVSSISGRVEIEDARGPVSVQTVSGTIDVGVDGSAPVTIESISGKILVRLPAGVRPDVRVRTVSGRSRIEVEPGDDVTITIRTVSGSVEVTGP